MSYQEKLNPWTIVRMLPDLQKVTVARFRRRNEAEGRLKILNRMMPLDEFVILFENCNDAVDSNSSPPQEGEIIEELPL